MSDIVVRLEMRDAADADAFGDYLKRFVADLAGQTTRSFAPLDAPPLMVRSEPLRDAELRVVTFQAPQDASAFARGWRRARRGAGDTAERASA